MSKLSKLGKKVQDKDKDWAAYWKQEYKRLDQKNSALFDIMYRVLKKYDCTDLYDEIGENYERKVDKIDDEFGIEVYARTNIDDFVGGKK